MVTEAKSMIDCMKEYSLIDLFNPFSHFFKGVYQGLEDGKTKAVQTVQAIKEEFYKDRMQDMAYSSSLLDYYAKYESLFKPKKPSKVKGTKRRLPKINLSYKIFD